MMKPMEQIHSFLEWFSHQGVNAFDIHVRKPKRSHEDYREGEWIWLNHHENVSAEYIRKKLLPWIKYENVHGADIYFRPFKDGTHAVIFLDDVPLEKALKVAQKYTACVIETSSHNTQIWLGTTKALDKRTRKSAQMFLKGKGYTDPGSISGDHLGRLCGVISQKHASWVNLIAASIVTPYVPVIDKTHLSPLTESMRSVYNVEKINKQRIEDKIGGACALKTISVGNDTSASGKEFGWVLGMLRCGVEHGRVKEKLLHVATNRKKANVDKYVKYTLQKAINMLNFKGKLYN